MTSEENCPGPRKEQWDYRVYLKWAESVIEELDPHGIGIYPEDLAKEAMALPNHSNTQPVVLEGWKVTGGYYKDTLHFSLDSAEASAKCSDEAAELDGGSHWRRARIVPLTAALQTEGDGWLSEVAAERCRQDQKWGGPEHDDKKSPNDFVQHIEDYAGWARVMAGMGSYAKYRRRMVQVAALAGAAIEAVDRAIARTQPPAQQGGE
ncbi:hypothetical protein [Marinobacter shengliensis]|uniref:hypothetical protein n=1 Tax=Marinobacter shengliensis TaxID=1389223 RepID=UPI001E2955F3|nr:hypothetical protein [Marinobacter shengliensis]MCD1628293.1 hypothetical protein [Marinobacter shengliensis]